MPLRPSVFAAAVVLAACAADRPTTPPPTAAPTPVATPVPSPTPSSARVACGVGPGPGEGVDCPRTSPSFLAEVDAAINRVVERHPELFDFEDRAGRNSYFVKDIDGFFDQVVEEIAQGSQLCARVDADLEIAVKSDNSFSDQYKLMWSAGYIRRGESSYRATCTPAWF